MTNLSQKEITGFTVDEFPFCLSYISGNTYKAYNDNIVVTFDLITEKIRCLYYPKNRHAYSSGMYSYNAITIARKAARYIRKQ